MATNSTASAGLAPEIRESYSKVMLHTATPELVHVRFATKFKVPRGEGKVLNWRRRNLYDAATTPIDEGITPAGQLLDIDNIAVTVNQYGAYTEFTDRVVVQSIDPLLTENAKNLGQQAGNTLDQVARDVYTAGTNVAYGGNATSRVTIDSGDVITDDFIRYQYAFLKSQNARPFAGGHYMSIVDPAVMYDIMDLDSFKLTGYYQEADRIYDARVIKLFGIMFMETTNAKVFTGAGAGGINVHTMTTFGMDALGAVDIESMGLETIYKGPGENGFDPLNQRQTQGNALN